MKKIFAVVLIACLMGSALFAVGGKESESETIVETESSGSNASITVAIWDTNQEPGLRKILDDFTVATGIEATTDNWVSAYPNFNLQAYLDMMDDIVFRPYSNNTIAWELMSKEKLVDAWTGAKSAEEVCRDINTEMNAILSEE